MLAHFLMFLANLIVAGVLLRTAETKLAHTKLGAALTYVY